MPTVPWVQLRRLLRTAAAALVLSAGLRAAGAAEVATVETRQEHWERLRREKAEAVRAPQPGFLERNILALEKAEKPSILDWALGGLYPRLQPIGWGSQMAAGARFWQPDIGGSKVDVHAGAFYSQRSYESYELQVGLLPHYGRGLPIRSTSGDDVYELAGIRRRPGRQGYGFASVRYRSLPEVDFYGLGMESTPEDHTTYFHQDAWYDVVAGYQHSSRVVLAARAGYIQAFVAPGQDESFPTTQELFDETTVPGLTRQPDFLYASVLGLFDGRDVPHNPHKGAMLAVSASRFDDKDGDAYRFDRFAADARAYLPLGSHQRVLALRTLVIGDRPADGAAVPFYFQETLGGSHTLRGFQSFRFRGERLVLFQAEYRWEAAPAVELAAFVDSGRVASHTAEWSLDDLRTTGGFGLRIKSHDRVRFRFDVAKSSEETRLYFRFGSSF